MAHNWLDEWRDTLAEDKRRAGLLPKGQEKNLLNKKLRDMEVILEVVGTLPESDPFRDRVEAVARLMKDKVKDWDGVLKEFAACAKIAGSMKRRQAAGTARAAVRRARWRR